MLLIILFFLTIPNISSAQLKLGSKIKNCRQAFSRQSREVASYIKEITDSSSKEDIKEVWKKIPSNKMKHQITQQIFTEKEKISNQNKLFIAQEMIDLLKNQLRSSESSEKNTALNPKEIKQLYSILFDRIISDFSSIKKRRENNHLRDEVKDIKKQIYELFKESPKYIPIKTLRKLAKGVTQPKKYSKDAKKLHVQILKIFSEKENLKDIRTIQWLLEGLKDFSPEVRKETVETLGQIFNKVESNVLIFLKQEPFIYLYLTWITSFLALSSNEYIVGVAVNTTLAIVNVVVLREIWSSYAPLPRTYNIEYNIARKLDKAVYDPEIKVRESAIKSITKFYPFFIDSLIETIVFSSNDTLKKEAHSSLINILDEYLTSKKSYLLRSIYNKELKKENVFKHVIDPLYGGYDNRNEHRHVILNFLEKNKIQAKQYKPAQDEKARTLEEHISKWKSPRTLEERITRGDTNHILRNPFDSWFEIELFLELHKKGYIVLPQFPISKMIIVTLFIILI